MSLYVANLLIVVAERSKLSGMGGGGDSMKRLLAVFVLTMFVVVMFAGSAFADLPSGQCKKIDPPGQERHCLNRGAPAADQHCEDIKSPTQRERCKAEANP